MKPTNQSAIMKTIGKLSDRFFPVDEKKFDFSSFDYVEHCKNESVNSFFKIVPEAVLIFNQLKSKLEYISPNYEQITGHSAAEMLAKGPDFTISLIHPEHAEIYNKEILPDMFRQYVLHCLNHDPKNIRFVCTFKSKGPNNKDIWLMNNVSVVETIFKKIPHIIMVFATEITEFKQDEALTFTTLKKNLKGVFEPVKAKRFYGLNKKEKFTKKELTVLYLLSTGHSTQHISKELFISPKTVYNHRKNLLKKTGTNNIHQLIQKANSGF